MPSAVRLREDYSAEELRALARRSKTVNQSRRLLSLAAVRDGMDRDAAAKIGGWTARPCVTASPNAFLVTKDDNLGLAALGVGDPKRLADRRGVANLGLAAPPSRRDGGLPCALSGP